MHEQSVREYLVNKYKKTLWAYFNLRTILNIFGEEGKDELNELAEQGLLTRREGANHPLVLIFPEKFEELKDYEK